MGTDNLFHKRKAKNAANLAGRKSEGGFCADAAPRCWIERTAMQAVMNTERTPGYKVIDDLDQLLAKAKHV